MRLEGKTALITGGTSGIGKATVKRFVAEGADVVFTGRNETAGRQIAIELGATFMKHDVQDVAGYESIAKQVQSSSGRLDIAFANAGTEIDDGDIESISLDAWNNLVSINMTGAMLTAKMAVELMSKNPEGPSGSIILNSSMTAHAALGNYVAYSTAKAGLIALAKSIAVHCCGKGYKIRCNTIHPGVIETELITKIISQAQDTTAARAQFDSMSAMRRMGRVEEIAGLVTYLGSDEAAFVSGSSYNIDGASIAGMMGV